MEIRLKGGLPYVNITLSHDNKQVAIEDELIDTGSASTVFSADRLLEIGLKLEPHDVVHRIRGVGGAEFVFTNRVGTVTLGALQADDFEIEIGAMQYGFAIEGIIGPDFLMEVEAVIDLGKMEIYSSNSQYQEGG